VKNTTLVLGAFAATFAAASVYLGVQLGDARDQLAAVEQERATDQARIRQMEAEFQGLEAAIASVEDLGAPPPGSPPPALATNRDAVKSPPPGMPGPLPLSAERRSTPDNSPAAQNDRRLRQEIQLRRRYAEMPAVLGLDTAQADKLYDLLAEYRIAEYEDGRPYQGDRLGRQSVENAARQQRDAAIEALLGPDKAAEFQSFEKSIPARMQVNRIGESMAASSIPLSEEQRKTLTAAVMKEQEAHPPPERATDGTRDPDYEMRFLEWQADYSSRVQASITPLLSSEQARLYRETVQVQNARREERRSRAEARRDGNPR